MLFAVMTVRRNGKRRKSSFKSDSSILSNTNVAKHSTESRVLFHFYRELLTRFTRRFEWTLVADFSTFGIPTKKPLPPSRDRVTFGFST